LINDDELKSWSWINNLGWIFLSKKIKHVIVQESTPQKLCKKIKSG